MMVIITTRKDLQNWVSERLGSDAMEGEIRATVGEIEAKDERPQWGKDWSEFLDSLPDNLNELCD